LKKYQKTSDAKKGGLFVGKSHAKGGIPAIVVDTGQQIEVEGGEAIINKEATKKYWKELSEINQSAGGGVPIPPPMEFSGEVERYKGGGKITMSAIRQGTEIEMEHAQTIEQYKKSGISVKEVAQKIAKDHLKENPNYYKVLTKLKLAKGGEIVCRSCGNNWQKHQKDVGMNVYQCESCGSQNAKFYKKGGQTAITDKEEIYKEWKTLVNMSKSELQEFYNSAEGKKAGLSSSEARQLGIDNGRNSARWIMKMKDLPFVSWSPTMWKWAKKQISFIKRMSGNKGSLYDENGKKTRKYTSLLIWGHNPEKFKLGGKTIAQTPAPKKEQIFGSEINKPKSSESRKSAEKITLSEQTIESINGLLEKHNSISNKSVDLNTAKAVVRRGMGAYSTSHRPTISGGKPNSRVAWGLARLKAFLFKVKTGKSKSGKYSQDNDLIEELGYEYQKFAKGSKIPSKNSGGDCYYVAGTIALNEKLPKSSKEFKIPNFVGTPYVVHAEVSGQGAISGLRYGHAWVEDDLNVYDFSNGREIVFPKHIYYLIGNVVEKKPKYYKYTFKEAIDKMLSTGHYGSWELITESGL
jgi:hypothetical protein